MSATGALSEEIARKFFEVTLDLACIGDGERLLRVNSRWTEVLGHSPEELLSRHYSEFVHPDDRERTAERIAALIDGNDDGHFENRWMTAGGDWRTLAWRARLDRETGLIFCSGRDVTVERTLERERDRMNLTLEALSELQSTYIDSGLDRRWWDKALESVIELSECEFGFVGRVEHDPDGAPFLRSYAVTDIAWNDWSREHYEAYAEGGMEFHNLQTLFGATLRTGELVISDDPSNDERRGGLPEGHPPLLSYAGIPLNDPEGLVGMVGLANRTGGFDRTLLDLLEPITAMLAQIISRDVSSKRAAHDPLTGLANRSALIRAVEPMLAADDRRRRRFGVLLVDLDGFKEVNDSLGHQAGDAILVEAGRAAAAELRSEDLLARLGGDEFAIVLPDCDLEELEQAGARVRSAIERVTSGPGRKVGASIGGVVVGRGRRDWGDVYRAADSNLYEAKRAGGGTSAITSLA